MIECLLSVSRILFLNFILMVKDVQIEKYGISMTSNLLNPEIVCETQSFLKFINFYPAFKL